METNTADYQDSQLPLTEPHFDTEETVLSARPVVPLEEIKTGERLKKRFAIVAVILFAAVVGALTATLIYKNRPAVQSSVNLESAVAGVAAIRIDDSETAPIKPVAEPVADASALEIISERVDPAPGTHFVKYSSAIDDIEIIHTAHNRTGFATGAVLAAEFLRGKKGVFNMKDVLGLNNLA